MNPTCTSCGKPSATIQADLFGGPQVCLACLAKARIDMMLRVLPDANDLVFNYLTEFEQSFLASVRQQFVRKGVLSEKQYQVLERIYEKRH